MSFQPIEEVLRQKEKFCIIKTVIKDDDCDPEITAIYVKDEADILPILKEEEKYIDTTSSYSKTETDYKNHILRTIQIYVCFTNFSHIQQKIYYTIVSHDPFSREIYDKIYDIVCNWNIYQ